ncbi:urate hydroxylase PuuD [Undibacterium sp. WLX3042]|uniref:urate hydroxylase PuuD n=1 Tax=Undibacterium sp. WLX3042 TaxID=3412686 RepID=UPI003C3062E2
MEAYLFDWANLLLRWLHVIVAIAWIGSSFYFVWLDNHLTAPSDPQLKAQGVGGELWAVHGGGFYNPQKYLGAPPKLPEHLHWFYWESYSTWLSGFSLFLLVYIFNARTYLIDPSVANLTPALAIAAALGFLALGWLVYDLLCRLFGKNEKVLSALIIAYVIAAAWAACHLFSGRAAFLITGAMIATIMSANVFFWIIPGQRKVVAAMKAGDPVDPVHGQRGKQRSVHNTYFTLPVLFAMLSNHYSMTYNHAQNWLVLVLIMIVGVLVRQFFILRHKGKTSPIYPVLAIVILAALAAWMAPKSAPVSSTKESPAAQFAQVQQVIQARCIQCHAEHPTLTEFPAKGLMLDKPEQIRAASQLIYQQVVQQKLMPLGNLTHITDEERAVIARWVENDTANMAGKK